MSSKKRWSWPTCKKGESRESKVKDKHPGNSMPMFGIPNPLQDSILTGTWREPSCLGVPFWGGVNTVKACFLFLCNNRCKFAVRTLHFGTPNPQLCCFSKITHQTIATGDPNVTGRVRWMFRKKRPAHKGCEQRMLRFHEHSLGCPLIWCALQKKSGAKMGFQIHLILESHPLSMENLQNAHQFRTYWIITPPPMWLHKYFDLTIGYLDLVSQVSSKPI